MKLSWSPQDHVTAEALLRSWDPGGVPLPASLFGSPYVKPQQLIAKAIVRLQIEADVLVAVAAAAARQRRGELPAEFDLLALADGIPQVVGDKREQAEALALDGDPGPLAFYRTAEACERSLYRGGTQRCAGTGGKIPDDDDGGEGLAPVAIIVLGVVGIAAIAAVGWIGGEKVNADAEANRMIGVQNATAMFQALRDIETAKAAYAAGQIPTIPPFVKATSEREDRGGLFAFLAPLALGAGGVGAAWAHQHRKARRSSSAITLRRNPR